jgi:hypothetical protein
MATFIFSTMFMMPIPSPDSSENPCIFLLQKIEDCNEYGKVLKNIVNLYNRNDVANALQRYINNFRVLPEKFDIDISLSLTALARWCCHFYPST